MALRHVPRLTVTFSGYSGIHKEGIRQEVQPDVALHRWSEFRVVRDPRDAPFHIFLLMTGGDTAVQERLNYHSPPVQYSKENLT